MKLANLTALVAGNLVFATFAALATAADSPLTVHVRSGRTFSAPVDVRTDESTLWLRFEGRSVRLLRPVDWNDITSAYYEGESIDLDSLRPFAHSLANHERLVDRLPTRAPGGQPHDETARQLLFVQPVESFHIDAQWGDRDSDRVVDGVTLQLAVRDRKGNAVPANLRIEATLEMPSSDERPHHRGAFEQVQRWVVAADRPGVHLSVPSAAQQCRQVGRLTVRVTIPGEGTFERQTIIPPFDGER